MTGRFIILIERDAKTVFPIVETEDGREQCIALYPSRDAAELAADNTMACRAWSYTVFDLDDVL